MSAMEVLSRSANVPHSSGDSGVEGVHESLSSCFALCWNKDLSADLRVAGAHHQAGRQS